MISGKYKIIKTAGEHQDLELTVNQWMEEGWRPVGSPYRYAGFWYQALEMALQTVVEKSYRDEGLPYPIDIS